MESYYSKMCIRDRFWSNFWLVIGQPNSFQQILWGQQVGGIPLQWGALNTNGRAYLWGDIVGDPNLIGDLVTIIRQFKPAWTSCRGIIFLGNQTGFSLQWNQFNYGTAGDKYGLGEPTGTGFALFRIYETWEA